MQITDEMVEAALDAYDAPRYAPCEKRMRAALEAALGPLLEYQRKQAEDIMTLGQQVGRLEAALVAQSKRESEIVMSLRMACGYSNITDEVRKSCSHASNGLVIDAAACIEDLAAALKEVISVSDRATDIYNRARATLERWGLK